MKTPMTKLMLAAAAAILLCLGAMAEASVVTIAEGLGGVQLWEGGPYWAECNVGATKPEEYGYYFWWGDTVGYSRSGGTLTSNFVHPEYYTNVTWVSSTGEQMSSSPFDNKSCPTYEKENAELLSAGYIDSTTNLVAAHDAATAHLGAPWRMPTSAEIEALVSNCTTEWITTNGVNGRLVTGQGAYANRSIFLPAAGFGSGSSFYDPGSQGDFWASTPISDFSYNAWRLYFSSSNFRQSDYSRYLGQPVRPVRGSLGAAAATLPANSCIVSGSLDGPTPSASSTIAMSGGLDSYWRDFGAAVAGSFSPHECRGVMIIVR